MIVHVVIKLQGGGGYVRGDILGSPPVLNPADGKQNVAGTMGRLYVGCALAASKMHTISSYHRVGRLYK